MKPALQASDGTLYPLEVEDQWGINGIGDGYGPEPRPFHLVPDPRTGALQVAKGRFRDVEVADATDEIKEVQKAAFARPFTVEKGGKSHRIRRLGEEG